MDRIENVVLRRDISFGHVDKDQLEAELKDLRYLSKHGDKDNFILSAMRLLALPKNGHTRLVPNVAINILPLRFVAIGAHIYLTSAPPEHRRDLDNQLLAVNDVPVADIIAKTEPLLAGTASRQRSIGALLFAWPSALLLAGAGGDGPQTKYTFTDIDACSFDFTVSHDSVVCAQDIYPIREKGHLGQDNETMSANIVSKELTPQIRYLALRDFSDPTDHTLETQLETAARAILENSAINLIIDMRGNPGGNFLKTLSFLKAISQGWHGRRCAVLTNKFTFSAAIVFVALLKDALKCRVQIVGEEMGDQTSFFAEGGWITLPQTGALVRYSTGYHDWKTGVATPSTPPEIAPHLVAAGTLYPDYLVDINARDIRSGRDPQLEAAVATFSIN